MWIYVKAGDVELVEEVKSVHRAFHHHLRGVVGSPFLGEDHVAPTDAHALYGDVHRAEGDGVHAPLFREKCVGRISQGSHAYWQ